MQRGTIFLLISCVSFACAEQSVLTAAGFSAAFNSKSIAISPGPKKASQVQIGRMSLNGPSFVFRCDLELGSATWTFLNNGKIGKVEKFEKIAKSDIDAVEKIACEFPVHAQSIREAAIAMTMKDGNLWMFEYVDSSGNLISQVFYEDLMSDGHKNSLKGCSKMIDSVLISLREKYLIKELNTSK